MPLVRWISTSAVSARQVSRLPTPDGKIAHAEMKIGDSVFMLSDEMPGAACKSPQSLGGTPVSIWIYTEDVDSIFNRAVQAGATVKMPLADMFWATAWVHPRSVRPSWSLATHKEVGAGRVAEAGPTGNGQDGPTHSARQILRALETGWIQWI